jgi:site-specific recombinase XerD
MQAFFTERLIGQRQASPHTIAAYRDTFRLLLGFAQQRTGSEPHALDIEDLDAVLVTAFLDHLERDRGNGPRTRNARLAAIRSLYHYAALRHPEHEATIQTGLRVSELIALSCQDAHLASAPHIRATGKGRKQRITPLTAHTTEVLRRWTKERAGHPDQPLFPTSRGRPLSRDAVALVVNRHAKTAAERCPTLATKTISPHVLRHTAAMNLLHAGVDTSVIALWLGHESTEATQIYLHANMAIKERALARTTPIGVKPGRYHAADSLLAFLERL